MTVDPQAAAIARQRVVLSLPAADIDVVRDVPYRQGAMGPLVLDLRRPRAGTAAVPAVVFVTGVRDAGARARLGCNLKDMGAYVSWAELAAASGMAGVTYVNDDPFADARTVLDHLRRHGGELGVDAGRLAVWSASGNVPTALALLMDRPAGVRCAALHYGYTLDADGSTGVSDASARWGFVNAAAGRSVDDLPAELPLFVTRAGRDEFAGLNDALDRFTARALARNLPITLVNHADGPHAFDLFDDRDASRAIIRATLGFLRFHLQTDGS